MKIARLISLLFILSCTKIIHSEIPKNLNDFYLTAKFWSRVNDFKNPKIIKDEIKKKLNLDLEPNDILVAVNLAMLDRNKMLSENSAERILKYIPHWLPIKYFFNESLFGEIELKRHMYNTKDGILYTYMFKTEVVLHMPKRLAIHPNLKTNEILKLNIQFTLASNNFIDDWLCRFNDNVIKNSFSHENDVTKHYEFKKSIELELAYKNFRRRNQSKLSKMFKKF